VDDGRSQPQPGQVVKILRGRELGKYAIIVQIIDSRYVMIADGNKRKFDRAKKKNLLHLQLQDFISSEVVNSLLETGRVTNGKIRFALSKFIDQQQSEAQAKGE
jgi:large subunit ribosomal protein L14e